jgi:hypothetical protein
MKLSTAQQHLHWALWKRVKAKLMPGRETWTKHEETERRHALYVQALGDEKSLTAFDNDDFDKVKAAMLAIVEPTNLNAQLHALNGQRKRLLFGIRRLVKSMGADELYVAGIVRTMNAEGKLGSEDLEQLHPRELTKVMIALRQHEKRGCLHAQTSPGDTGVATASQRRRHHALVGGPMHSPHPF